MIGILGASRYEAVLEGGLQRSTVSTRYGDVPVLTGAVGNRAVVYIRRFGWEGQPCLQCKCLMHPTPWPSASWVCAGPSPLMALER